MRQRLGQYGRGIVTGSSIDNHGAQQRQFLAFLGDRGNAPPGEVRCAIIDDDHRNGSRIRSRGNPSTHLVTASWLCASTADRGPPPRRFSSPSFSGTAVCNQLTAVWP